MGLSDGEACAGGVENLAGTFVAILFREREHPRKLVGHELREVSIAAGCRTDELSGDLKQLVSCAVFSFRHEDQRFRIAASDDNRVVGRGSKYLC